RGLRQPTQERICRLRVESRSSALPNLLYGPWSIERAFRVSHRHRQQASQPGNVVARKAIRIALAVEPLVMRADDQTHPGQGMGKIGQLLPERRVLLHERLLGVVELAGGLLPPLDELAGHPDQSDVVHPGADFQSL